MYSIYVDIPNDYKYNWNLGSDVNDVLSAEFGIPIKFFRNSYANISFGDCYRADFTDEQEAIAFLLKTGFAVVNGNKITEYLHRTTMSLG